MDLETLAKFQARIRVIKAAADRAVGFANSREIMSADISDVIRGNSILAMYEALSMLGLNCPPIELPDTDATWSNRQDTNLHRASLAGAAVHYLGMSSSEAISAVAEDHGTITIDAVRKSITEARKNRVFFYNHRARRFMIVRRRAWLESLPDKAGRPPRR